MARTKSRRKAGSRKQSNPRRRQNRRRNPVMVTRRRHARRNPAINVMGYAKLGLSVVGGAVGSKFLTQAVLSSSNTGIMGYFGNLVATIALGYGAKMAFRDETIAQGVIGGGIAQIAVRVLTDNTPYGSVLSNAGVGDYQTNWNFVWPQRVQPGYPPRYIQAAALGGAPAAVPVVTHAVAGKGMGAYDWN